MACPVRQKQKHSASRYNLFLRLNVVCLLATLSLISLTLSFIKPPPPASANRALPTDLSYSTETTWLLPGLPNLSDTAGTIPHTFSQSVTVFQVGPETVHGFRAGKAYTEMYARHIPWQLDSAQYYYPDEYLREPIEAYLRRQYTSSTPHPGAGAIGGVFSPQGSVSKQTVTGDEETSLIHAAYLYYNLSYDTGWLNSLINNKTVIERLNLAADWLYTHKLHARHRLIWRGNSTDWGTIKAEGGPDYSTFNPTHDSQTISIYDQALAYAAFLELAQMNAAAGDNTRADQWQARAEQLKREANALLWQADKGYYLSRAHVISPKHTVNEAEMVSISNALAVYAGLTDAQQNQTIFQNLEKARISAGAGKPGVAIYPYYPGYIFAHPKMGRGSYENGGIWDLWGGLQTKAEFLTGFSQIALTHLLQIANEWQNHPGNIIEWQSATEAGPEGSHYFTAAAGTVGSAIIEGLFGIQLNGGGLTLQPRLGLNDGYIRVYQPATDRYAAYSYDWSQNVTRLNYGTNAKGAVLIKILKLQSEQVNAVTVDSHPVAFGLETVGNDTYVAFTAPEGQHTIEIIKGQPVVAEPVAASETEQLNASSSGPSLAPNINSPHQMGMEQNLPTGDTPASFATYLADESRQATLRLVGVGTVITISLILVAVIFIRRIVGLTPQRPKRKSAQPEPVGAVQLATPPAKNKPPQ